ncbi:MAG: Eco57I restriction-modification methylase domain-containing protein [Desulfobacula sp.]|nr:Eco57I restriction-modification methylase domain-containing protein [Desulfobacula sp.]
MIRKGPLYLENDSHVIEKGKETTAHQFKLPPSVRNHAKKIDDSLAGIKICDPAIGSGAFPVGMLHEIVNTRLVLEPYTKNGLTAYDYKRHAIHESLYGVDYDASAIDIARLRLWLSLVVDEEDYTSIKALPNLDYKIIQGNSLIGLDERYRPAWLSTIEALKEDFYQCKDPNEKIRLKDEINKKLYGHLKSSKSHSGFYSKSASGYKIDFDFKLFFSEVWAQNDGFDIVIGNPPYVQIQNFSGQQIQKDLEKQNYETFAKTGDIYCLFYEKGYRLLKKGGGLCFITSNKWMKANYGERLRQFFNKKTDISILIDFGDSPIFTEAVTYTNILLFCKQKSHIHPPAWDLTKVFKVHSSLNKLLSENSPGCILTTKDSFVIASKEMADIKIRIETSGMPLKDLASSINYGMKTGFNEAFILDGRTKDRLISEDPKNEEILKPILRGRDIKRYHASFADLWLINSHNGYNGAPAVNLDDYPSVKQHLEAIEQKRIAGGLGKSAIKAKGLFNRDDQGKTPYNLRSCAYIPDFYKEKIIWLEMSPRPNFTYSSTEMFVLNTSYILTGDNLLSLLAMLNSSIMDFYFALISSDVRGKTRRYIKQYVEKIPIHKNISKISSSLSALSSYLLYLSNTENGLFYSYFEQLIDGLAYELYFPDELKTAGKEIFSHVGKLVPVSDQMTEEKKLAVIQKEFDRLYNPAHPVRNHLETLDSVSIVRIIQKELKR